MKKKYTLLCLMAGLVFSACSNNRMNKEDSQEEVDTVATRLEGDSAIYGMACEGTNDTILILLPITDISSDPDTFNILRASKQQRVYGIPQTGDRMAVVLEQEDSTTAYMAIDLDQLLGTWCYEVVPTLRQRADLSVAEQQKILSNMPDSVRQEMMMPKEYGIQLMGDHSVHTVGFRPQPDNDESFVIYPTPRRYHQWQLFNGRLLLTTMMTDSLGQQYLADKDTVRFVLMRKDSLVLEFNGERTSYYRQKEKDENPRP